MPYIDIKSFPRDEKTKQMLADRINDVVLEVCGCRQESVSLSIEEIAPEAWDEKVLKGIVEPNREKMMIYAGEKQYGKEPDVLTIFYLSSCPYCRKARKALEELCEESPAYRTIPVDWIEEGEHPEIAEQYDYYSVPSIFSGHEKFYEASTSDNFETIKTHVKQALDLAQKG